MEAVDTGTADLGLLNGIQERQEVIGTCGGHVGTVEAIEAGRVRLIGSEPDSGSRYLDGTLVRSVNDKVHLSTSAEDARAAFTLR